MKILIDEPLKRFAKNPEPETELPSDSTIKFVNDKGTEFKVRFDMSGNIQVIKIDFNPEFDESEGGSILIMPDAMNQITLK